MVYQRTIRTHTEGHRDIQTSLQRLLHGSKSSTWSAM